MSGGHLDARGPEKGGEQFGDVLGVGHGDGDAVGAQLPYRVDEAEGGAGGGHTGRPGQGGGLFMGTLPAVQETATAARPHDGLDTGALQLRHSGGQTFGCTGP